MKHTERFAAAALAALLLVGCESGDGSASDRSAEEMTYEKFEVEIMEGDTAYSCDTLDSLLEKSTAVVLGEYVGEPVTEGDAPRPGITKAQFRIEQVLDGSVTAAGDSVITVAGRYEFRSPDDTSDLALRHQIPSCALPGQHPYPGPSQHAEHRYSLRVIPFSH